jgi:hypothetical protein
LKEGVRAESLFKLNVKAVSAGSASGVEPKHGSALSEALAKLLPSFFYMRTLLGLNNNRPAALIIKKDKTLEGRTIEA